MSSPALAGVQRLVGAMKAKVAGPNAKTQVRAEFEAEAKAKAEALRTLGLPAFKK